MKLLKQFHFPCAIHTSLKRGVNERAAGMRATCVTKSLNSNADHLINTRLQSGADERSRGKTVLTVSQIGNLK